MTSPKLLAAQTTLSEANCLKVRKQDIFVCSGERFLYSIWQVPVMVVKEQAKDSSISLQIVAVYPLELQSCSQILAFMRITLVFKTWIPGSHH